MHIVHLITVIGDSRHVAVHAFATRREAVNACKSNGYKPGPRLPIMSAEGKPTGGYIRTATKGA